MPYKKKISKTIEKAKIRISGMKALEPALDIGNGLSVEAYSAAIQDTEQRIEAYNTAVSAISQLSSAAEKAEKDLAALSERMLSTVAGRYGRTSDEYAIAGGTKRTNRRRAPKKKAETLTETLAGI
jgi:translation initiation factor 2 alpha subunit (eIF-2alpha)